MKKVLTIIAFACLFIYFLIYAGAFRDNSDPVEVTRFYFDCMRNYDWILTYPVTKYECFDVSRLLRAKTKWFYTRKVKNITLNLSSIKNNQALVQARLEYENEPPIEALALLEKTDGENWLITEVQYHE